MAINPLLHLLKNTISLSSPCCYCCCSDTQLCLTLCDPLNGSTPGFPVLHYLLEFVHTHVHGQWCHPIISSSSVPFSSCLQSFRSLSIFNYPEVKACQTLVDCFLNTNGYSECTYFAGTGVQFEKYQDTQCCSLTGGHSHRWPCIECVIRGICAFDKRLDYTRLNNC